ncbi:hypothetical protein [Galenea microaerophila]
MRTEFKHGDLAVKMINDRLKEISQELRDLQSGGDGTIILDLYDCGRKCAGCPHARWRIQRYKSGTRDNPLLLTFTLKEGKNPVRYLRRKGEFERNYERVKELVLEAKLLIKYKKEFILLHKRLLEMMRKIS